MTDPIDTLADLFKSIMDRKAGAPTRIVANKMAIIKVLKENYLGGARATYSGSCDSGQIDDVRFWPGNITVADALNPDARILKENSGIPDVSLQVLKAKDRWNNPGVPESLQTVTLTEAIEELLYDWLESNHGGWENNDGADGHMDLNVETGEVTFTHNINVTSQETETETL